MNEAQAIELIEEQFNTAWPGASGSVPFVLENEALPTTFDTFVLLTMTHTTTAQITVGQTGTRRVEFRGYIMVKVWVPVDGGRASAATLAGAARTVFAGVNIASTLPNDEPITVGPGATAEVGVDGRWFMQVVKFPFRYYTVM